MKNKIYFGGFRYHNYQMRGRNARYYRCKNIYCSRWREQYYAIGKLFGVPSTTLMATKIKSHPLTYKINLCQ